MEFGREEHVCTGLVSISIVVSVSLSLSLSMSFALIEYDANPRPWSQIQSTRARIQPTHSIIYPWLLVLFSDPRTGHSTPWSSHQREKLNTIIDFV